MEKPGMPLKTTYPKSKSIERTLKHSQNFICQPVLVEELIELSEINSSDLVVEIGAGKGIITQKLREHAGSVIAIEQDAKLAEELSSLNTQSNFQLVICDFRKWQLPRQEFKVFSNIPFNVTTEIITKLTSSDSLVTDIYLIMQEDAAYRFAGMPYRRNSQNSILLAVDFAVRIIRKISRDCIKPKPNVSLVFAHFYRHSKPLVSKKNRQLFRDFVVYCYNQWAPTILQSLKKVFSNKQLDIIDKTQKLEGLKPSELTIEQWIELFNTYCQHVTEHKQRRVKTSEKHLKIEQKKLDKWHRSRQY
jgi:23S rRNA (adenine-N6)-dimethyltransferase